MLQFDASTRTLRRWLPDHPNHFVRDDPDVPNVEETKGKGRVYTTRVLPPEEDFFRVLDQHQPRLERDEVRGRAKRW